MLKAQKKTRKKTLNSVLTNIFRGKNSTVGSILSVHRAIMSHQSELLTDLNDQVLQLAFSIPTNDFGAAMDIESNNLVQIEKLSRNTSLNVELNYLHLVTKYIALNPDRVNAWIALDRAASTDSFVSSGDSIRDALLNLPAVDQQAMASLRLYAALHSYSDDIIREYLSTNMPSDWTRNRLLYPLIYYAINLPDPTSLDQMLSHVFPSKGTGPAEKILAKFLLLPDHPETANLALRCYVALISHPYDALEYVVIDLERRIADGDTLDKDYLQSYEILANSYPDHRVAKLVAMARREPLPFRDIPKRIHGLSLGEHADVNTLLLAAFDNRCSQAPTVDNANILVKAITDVRWSRYPAPMNFEEVLAYARRFAMLSSARLVRFLATGLYMFSRDDAGWERLVLVQGILILGTWSPFHVASPQGYNVALLNRIAIDHRPTDVMDRTLGSFGSAAEQRVDRTWIKAANWSLMTAQSQGRISEWASAARSKFPIWVYPRYLSGLDWQWFSDVIKLAGMRDLMGNVDIVYVLFLKQLEEFRRESVSLRVAIEPIARDSKHNGNLNQWLRKHFDRDSVAFIRYFMSADTILKLRLTDNYVAAVSYRIELLEGAVQDFGFRPEILDEAALQSEQDSLTAMLCRMSVGARQFEIGWETLAENAAERTRDAYTAYETITQAMPEEAIANTRRSSSYQFSNGSAGDYECRNRDWPLVLLIAGVIDTFLTHPTMGIEAILSVRIRHDSFRREYESALHQVESGSVVGVSRNRTKYLVPQFAPAIYREIQLWLDKYMHATRKEKPHGFFNFVPTKSDMSSLVDQAIGKNLRDIIDDVFAWIKPRLDVHLARARVSLAKDLGPKLERRVQLSRVEDTRDDPDARRVADAVAATVARRTLELEEWFKVPDVDRDQSLNVGEVLSAVRQRFRLHLSTNRLVWKALSEGLAARNVTPPNIRHVYDLFSEVLQNSIKHSDKERTAIKTCIRSLNDIDYLVVSNNCVSLNAKSEEIIGHPYETPHDALFGEGKSGLKKIAYLSASIMGAPSTIMVRQRNGYFHIIIPVDTIGQKQVYL